MSLLTPYHPRGVGQDDIAAFLSCRRARGRWLRLPKRGNPAIDHAQNIVAQVERWDEAWSGRWTNKTASPLSYGLSHYKLLGIHDLLPTDAALNIPLLLEILSGTKAADASRCYSAFAHKPNLPYVAVPYVVKFENCYYIINGHHRLWLSAALGQTFTFIRTFDADCYFRDYPIPHKKRRTQHVPTARP